jgi:hypothetical protein
MMYDSRSSHPRNRGSRWDRHWADGIEQRQRAETLERMQTFEGLVAYLDGDEPAMIHLSPSIEAERAHAEALRWNMLVAWERELLIDDPHFDIFRDTDILEPESELAWNSDAQAEVDRAWDEMDRERQSREDAQYDGAFGGYHDDCWMPLATTMQECREIFGGTDFIIQHTNVVRRTA